LRPAATCAGTGTATATAGTASDGRDGYPEFTLAMLKKLGWNADLTPQELAVIQKIGGQG
jgi:formate dehydrogenase major subunit